MDCAGKLKKTMQFLMLPWIAPRVGDPARFFPYARAAIESALF